MTPPFQAEEVSEERVVKATLHRPSTQSPSDSLFRKAYEIAATFNWPAGSFIIITHIIAFYALFVTPYYLMTCLLNLACLPLFTMPITAGYHRLWSHKTYETNRIMKTIFAILGTGAFSMSVIDWAKDHRTHHKYTDTDKDPYDSTKGLWYSHMGWLMWAREMPKADVRDLEADPLLRFQHKHFPEMGFLVGLILPILITGFGWQDWEGGFYVAIIRIVVVHNSIFSINSLAHWAGDTPVTTMSSARDNILLAILTCGEGYHNFHHEFPNDYRNGIKWYAVDPTKWLIAGLEKIGWSWELKRTPNETIAKAEIHTMLKILQEKKKNYFWGKEIKSLPVYTRELVEKEVAERKASLVIVDNIVYDVSEFIPMHPGGEAIVKAYLGKDVTKAFNGGVYKHTCSAKDILDTLRVGILCDEMRCQ